MFLLNVLSEEFVVLTSPAVLLVLVLAVIIASAWRVLLQAAICILVAVFLLGVSQIWLLVAAVVH